MVLTGENWSTGRETLCSVGGRGMNGYGALVEWYWQGKTEVLGEKHYIVWVVGEWMGMEHWWNDTDRGNWSTGRETLYSVGGRWMNEYGALMEWYWHGKTEILGEKHYAVWVVGEWMVWSIGRTVLRGENWSTGREILYSVGCRWMNGYGALVEWYWQGKTEVLGEKHYAVWVVGEWMGMEHWWNDTDRGKLKFWERNII